MCSGQKVASSDIMLIGVVDPLSSFARQLKRDHAIAAATLQFCVHWFKGVIKSQDHLVFFLHSCPLSTYFQPIAIQSKRLQDKSCVFSCLLVTTSFTFYVTTFKPIKVQICSALQFCERYLCRWRKSS